MYGKRQMRQSKIRNKHLKIQDRCELWTNHQLNFYLFYMLYSIAWLRVLESFLTTVRLITDYRLCAILRPLGLAGKLDSYPGTPATSFYDPQSPPSAR